MKIVECANHMLFKIPYLGMFLSHCVICFRPFPWMFRRNWYARRWGIAGVDGIGRLWLVDIGAITIGWRDSRNALMYRKEYQTKEKKHD